MKFRHLSYLTVIVYIVLIILMFWITLFVAPREVDVEYINGILTASSILYGFWIVLLQVKSIPREVSSVFSFIALFLLLISVLMIYLNAIGLVSSTPALFACMASFIANTFMLFLTLYLYYLYHVTTSDQDF